MKNHRFSHISLYPPRGARRVPGEAGFTILELVVSVAVMGMVVVPIAMAFSVGFRVSAETEASLMASASRDRLAHRFSLDVAAVDATGASVSETVTCDTPTPGGGSLLVSLNSTTLVAGSPETTRVTYRVTGSGTDISVVRRTCANAPAGAPATNGTEVVVAERLGFPGATASAVVLGPGGGNPCNEFRCQLQVAGKYTFQVTAQRRIFGAGVPLEVGKIYSSSATRDATNGKRYQHLKTDASVKSKEGLFTDQLTLPPGLDGPPTLTVQYQVKQKLNNQWLVCPSAPTDYTTCTFTSPTPVPITGKYDATGPNANRWVLPLRVGPSDVLNAGGEYRVSTKLVPGNGQPTKQYGGTSGFPLWVDWYPEDVVFVKTGGTGTGDACANPTTPCGTVDAGLKVAKSFNSGAGRPEVLVADGTYAESIVATLGGGLYANNRTIVGGHNGTTWLRASASSLGTNLNGINGAGHSFTELQKVRFRQVAVSSGSVPSTNSVAGSNGLSTYGVIARGGATLFFENSRVSASDAQPGGNGANGADKGNACRGGDGSSNASLDTQPVTGRLPAGSRSTRPDGSAVPPIAAEGCVNNSAGERRAGNGGAGGSSVGNNGSGGGNGGTASVSNPTDARGGAGGGGTIFSSPPPAQPGGGAPAVAAIAAPGTVSATNTWSSLLTYSGAAGTSGGVGANGRGGGGAGGGGAQGLIDGNSGGAGGEGGLGGGAGGGGGYGGASIGLLVDGATTRVTLDHTPVTAGTGGAGGSGGRGGDGGYGGAGGMGTFYAFIIFPLGGQSAGGGGGSGGNGGGGGAGGQGGAAFSVLTQRSGLVTYDASSTTSLPTAGAGGGGGQLGYGGLGGDGGRAIDQTLWDFIFNIQVNVAGGPDGSRGRDGSPGQAGPTATACAKGTRPDNGSPITCE